MTEPATLPGDPEETIRSGGHDGQVFVYNPITRQTELVDPKTAGNRSAKTTPSGRTLTRS